MHAVNTYENRYYLHNLFFPVIDTRPSIASITYVVTFNNSNSQACPALKIRETLNISGKHNYTFGWSISGVYSVVHPALLRMLQPQFPFVILFIVQKLSKDIKNKDFQALMWDGLTTLNGIELNLIDLTLDCVPSDEQLQGTLHRITSLVSRLAYM